MSNGDAMHLDSFFDVPENAGVMCCRLYYFNLITRMILLIFRVMVSGLSS